MHPGQDQSWTCRISKSLQTRSRHDRVTIVSARRRSAGDGGFVLWLKMCVDSDLPGWQCLCLLLMSSVYLRTAMVAYGCCSGCGYARVGIQQVEYSADHMHMGRRSQLCLFCCTRGEPRVHGYDCCEGGNSRSLDRFSVSAMLGAKGQRATLGQRGLQEHMNRLL